MRTVPLYLVLALTSCKCLPVPTADATPPTAGLIVEYRPADGSARTTVTVSADDPDVTIDARRNEPISVIYSGGDPEGIRLVDLDYDMWYYTGTSVVRPLLIAIGVSSSCPRNPLLGSHEFEASTSPWTFTFVASATNWLGANTKSAKVTIRTQ